MSALKILCLIRFFSLIVDELVTKSSQFIFYYQKALSKPKFHVLTHYIIFKKNGLII